MCKETLRPGAASLPGKDSVNKVLEAGLILSVVGAVLAFGGTEPLSFSLVQVTLFLLSLFLICLAKTPPAATSLPLRGPLLLLAYLLCQLLWSAYPYGTSQHLLRWVSYLAAFYLATYVGRERATRRRLVFALLGLGLFEALYGILQYLTGWQQIFTYVKVYYREDATGTYINRNHFAGFLEMVLPLALAMAFYPLDRLRRHLRTSSGRVVAGYWLAPESLQLILFAFTSVILFTAIVFSRSRMGILSSAAAVLLLGLLRATSTRRAAVSTVTFAFFFAAALMAVWIGATPVLERYAQLGQEYSLDRTGRLPIWKDTWQLIRQHPLTGSGLGAFRQVYPQVQAAHLAGLVDHAHNDYLELATELGLPAAGFFFGMILTVMVKTLRAFFAAARASDRAVALGVFAALVALTLHSLTDFNLYIPANALAFSVVLGLGYATSLEVRAEASTAC